MPFDNSKREKEAVLNQYRLAQGLTIRELCEWTGITPGEYAGLNNGMISPIYEENSERQGYPRRSARLLSEFLEIDLESLFPRYWCRIFGEDSERFNIMEHLIIEQYKELIAAKMDSTERFENSEFVKYLLRDALTPREEQVMLARWIEDCSLEEVAKRFHVIGERIRQIERKSLRKLKNYIARNFKGDKSCHE